MTFVTSVAGEQALLEGVVSFSRSRDDNGLAADGQIAMWRVELLDHQLRVLREVILALEAKALTLYPEQLFVIGRNIVKDGFGLRQA